MFIAFTISLNLVILSSSVAIRVKGLSLRSVKNSKFLDHQYS
jgi:hypothetical protein